MHLFSYFFASTQRNAISRVHSFQEIHVCDDFKERMDQLNDTYIKPEVNSNQQSNYTEHHEKTEPMVDLNDTVPRLNEVEIEPNILHSKEPIDKPCDASIQFEDSMLRETDFDFEMDPKVMNMSHFDFDLNESLMKWLDELLGEKKT